VITRLAEADVFAGLGFARREALWEAKAIRSDKPLPLFESDMDGEAIFEAPPKLSQMTLGEQVVEDYVSTRLSLKAHPVALLRDQLTPVSAGHTE
jgi:DNA polymerase III alpha subunit